MISACTGYRAGQGEPQTTVHETVRQVRWEENRSHLSKISSWNIRGKLGVKSGNKGGSATLKWRYAENDQEIQLSGPIGGGRVVITVDQNGAVLKDTKGKVITGDTTTEVLYQRLGWHVPFDQLADWARGLPSKGEYQFTLRNDGRLQHLIQDNWDVDYQSYRPVKTDTGTLLLPNKLLVSALPGTIEVYSKKGKYLGGELDVKVILKEWWDIHLASSNPSG